jgi:flavin reductase (DIM6/NTAB) family NADH-FMN oxidoreductase RutF
VKFDPTLLSEREQYKLMTGSIVPRPIALVTTMGRAGVNAAPFSLFNMVGTDPPALMFSIGSQGDGREKDTLANIRMLPEFVVHICSEAIAVAMNVCATDYPAHVSEVHEAGFTTVPSLKVTPPRIVEAPVHMECRVTEIVRSGKRHHIVIGEVVMFHFHDGVADDACNVDLKALQPIGRLSGQRYARIRDVFALDRLFMGEKPKQLR